MPLIPDHALLCPARRLMRWRLPLCLLVGLSLAVPATINRLRPMPSPGLSFCTGVGSCGPGEPLVDEEEMTYNGARIVQRYDPPLRRGSAKRPRRVEVTRQVWRGEVLEREESWVHYSRFNPAPLSVRGYLQRWPQRAPIDLLRSGS